MFGVAVIVLCFCVQREKDVKRVTGNKVCILLFWLCTMALLCKPVTTKEQIQHKNNNDENLDESFTLHNSYMNEQVRMNKNGCFRCKHTYLCQTDYDPASLKHLKGVKVLKLLFSTKVQNNVKRMPIITLAVSIRITLVHTTDNSAAKNKHGHFQNRKCRWV